MCPYCKSAAFYVLKDLKTRSICECLKCKKRFTVAVKGGGKWKDSNGF